MLQEAVRGNKADMCNRVPANSRSPIFGFTAEFKGTSSQNVSLS